MITGPQINLRNEQGDVLAIYRDGEGGELTFQFSGDMTIRRFQVPDEVRARMLLVMEGL